jgi:hypothetical protein
MLHSLGKIRGLQTAANMAGVFTILALDHGASFLKTINPKAPEMVTFDQAVATKTTLLQILAPHASAVLLDPIYGLWPAITGSAGDYADPVDRRGRLLAGWSVAQIKRIGAAAVKLFFYYHPEAGEAAQAQEALVAEVVDDIPKPGKLRRPRRRWWLKWSTIAGATIFLCSPNRSVTMLVPLTGGKSWLKLPGVSAGWGSMCSKLNFRWM